MLDEHTENEKEFWKTKGVHVEGTDGQMDQLTDQTEVKIWGMGTSQQKLCAVNTRKN